MSLPAAGAPDTPLAKLAKGAGATCSTAVVATAVSATAAAQSAAAGSSMFVVSADMMVCSQPALVGAGNQSIDLDRVAVVGGAVVAVEHGHAVDLGPDRRVEVEFDEVAGLNDSSCSTVACVVASSATSSTSAAWICVFSRSTQRVSAWAGLVSACVVL